jgi:hypothetical protein
MIGNAKRVYALREWTVELRPRGWFYWRTYGEKEPKGPYSSIASVTLMLARELLKEITRRDEPHQLPQ